MAVSLNSVISFNPTVNYQQARRANNRILLVKVPTPTSLWAPLGLIQSTPIGKRSRFYALAAADNNVAIETTDNESKSIETNDGNGLVIPASSDEVAPEESNEGALSDTSNSTPKRGPLTARERLRAARVLNRYTDPKPSKAELGSKLMESLRETDKGKRRPSLPEAPTNMLDDSKRGKPEKGWTINISAGMDVIVVVFSFVFISSAMFATTYLVWKLGAIHFNEL
ncbi:hypothetical protein ACP275_06G142000 [Erythranthe tilingii]